MHDDDELKAQCFGGDYMGEVYDNNLKRMQLRRQKRWWNAYMLFYTRSDQTVQPSAPSHIEQLSLAESRSWCLQMPAPIERSVRSQNLRFLHSRNLFATEFFNFVRKLVEYRGQSAIAEKLVNSKYKNIIVCYLHWIFVLFAVTAGRGTVAALRTAGITIPFPFWLSHQEIASGTRH